MSHNIFTLGGWGLPTWRAWRHHGRLLTRIYLSWPEMTVLFGLCTYPTSMTWLDRLEASDRGRRRCRLPRVLAVTADRDTLTLVIEASAAMTPARLTESVAGLADAWQVPRTQVHAATAPGGHLALRITDLGTADVIDAANE